jgi:hypothetical protein
MEGCGWRQRQSTCRIYRTPTSSILSRRRFVVWALGASYASAPALFDKQALTARVIEEAFWGADYLHRLLTSKATST